MASLSAQDDGVRDAAAVRSSGRRWGAAGFAALVAALRRYWGVGVLTAVGPDGAVHRIEGAEPGLEARIEVRKGRFVRRILGSGDVGFAHSYIAGEWDSPDLATLMAAFSANFDHIGRMLAGHPLLRLAQAIGHARNGNSRAGARRNIHAHYDLGNDFYRLWLDEGMTYSSALYLKPEDDLAAAQRNKYAALADALSLEPNCRLLEIGCGWGGFAAYAAAERGATVTAVTISRAQHELACRRIQAAGLAERVQVALCDYRDVRGRFDRIASIEMFEAVGEPYWPVFFSRVRDLLEPGGCAGLQIITIQDALFDGYRSRPDFIQLNVFPGGMLPSERRLRQETDRAGLAWTSVRRFGQDYAATLAAWSRLYRARAAEVKALGFGDEFDRLWRYYLAYCEAGFRTGRTDVLQLGLART